ncbi:MAG: DUF4159 domain-containing protein [Leptospirales bacterium]|nr:DUF4159 domain-containing protein [Leptospirales bacterium]
MHPFYLLVILGFLFLILVSILALLHGRSIPNGSQAQAEGVSRVSTRRPGSIQLRTLIYDEGDWDANRGSLENLAIFARMHLALAIDILPPIRGRDLREQDSLFLYATGHRGFNLQGPDLEQWILYIERGGFCLIEDNNGMDIAFRAFVNRNFPGAQMRPMSRDPQMFAKPFALDQYPKVMEHDGQPAQLLRVVDSLNLFYSFSSDLGDGWESPRSHRIPQSRRIPALRMGCNLIQFAANLAGPAT